MNFRQRTVSLSLDAGELAVQLRLAIDFLSKATKGWSNLALSAEQAAGRRLVMNFQQRTVSLSLDMVEEPAD